MNYCNMLNNLSSPTDVMLQSYHYNVKKHLEYMRKETSILKHNRDELMISLAKLK